MRTIFHGLNLSMRLTLAVHANDVGDRERLHLNVEHANMVIVVFRAWITIATRSPATPANEILLCVTPIRHNKYSNCCQHIDGMPHKICLLRHILPNNRCSDTAQRKRQWTHHSTDIQFSIQLRYDANTILMAVNKKNVQRGQCAWAGWRYTCSPGHVKHTEEMHIIHGVRNKKKLSTPTKGAEICQMARSNGKTATIANQNITTCGTWYWLHDGRTTKWVNKMQRVNIVIHIMDACSKIWRNKANDTYFIDRYEQIRDPKHETSKWACIPCKIVCRVNAIKTKCKSQYACSVFRTKIRVLLCLSLEKE